MFEDKTKRLSVYLPEKVKHDLEQMANETGLSMTQIIVMATHGLLSRYKSNGSGIFANLFSSDKQADDLDEKLASIHQRKVTMQEYYGARAYEYEKIYHREDTDYRRELTLLTHTLRDMLKDRTVLEVACGTGYWTKIASEVVKMIVGIDIRSEVLQIADEKNLPSDKVRFLEADAYQLDLVPGRFDFGLANFWFSHVPRNKTEDFLHGFHKKLQPGSRVFMADNVYVPGRGGELITKDSSEDTYKLRQLSDGTTYEIIKNYYSYNELHDIFQPIAQNVNIFVGNSFWYVSYTVA